MRSLSLSQSQMSQVPTEPEPPPVDPFLGRLAEAEVNDQVARRCRALATAPPLLP